ncbi:21767_t:CDS:2 [Racocetra persica]|uniref:21767_t:CDS:1 n=2 Tax=Racocetra persica TaxID=160502 RepID=A0ACA9K9Y0_9GLOM|nr:21766_t:CDS:2 [Racocetra persica]CAG8461065.1 21767_t:CDS:2 [Racocetra persica]
MASDVYSFGIIAYEIVSGLRAYHNAQYDFQLSRKIFYDGLRPDIPNHVPELVAKLIIKCWDIRPDKRPTSKEIYDTLNTWYNDILDDKPTEIVAQTREADKMLESKMSTSSHFDTYPEIYVNRQFDTLSAMDIENQVEQNSQSLLIMDGISQDDTNVHEHKHFKKL